MLIWGYISLAMIGSLESRTCEGRRLGFVDLDAVPSRLRNKDVSFVVNGHAGGSPEVFFAFQTLGSIPLAIHLWVGVQFVFAPL